MSEVKSWVLRNHEGKFYTGPDNACEEGGFTADSIVDAYMFQNDPSEYSMLNGKWTVLPIVISWEEDNA